MDEREETVELFKASARSIGEAVGEVVGKELAKIYEILIKMKETQLAFSKKLKELDERVKKLES